MKISLKIYDFTFLMLVLTFSMPFVAFTQQNPVMVETEAVVAQDTNGMNLEVKSDAEQDARADSNTFVWFGAGVCVGSCLTGIGAMIATLVADEMYPHRYTTRTRTGGGSSGSGWFPTIPEFTYTEKIPNQRQIDEYNRVRLVGTAAAPIVSSVLLYYQVGRIGKDASPPAYRFAGKPPAYIQAYTDVYKAKIKSLHRRSFLTGGIIGAVVGGGCALRVVLATQE